jgi:hypothetical protein
VRLPLKIGVGRMHTLKSLTSEEKDLIKRMFRQFTPEEQEYIDFVKADKQELWEENKQLKAALRLAAKDFVEQIGYGTVDFWVKYWMDGEG